MRRPLHEPVGVYPASRFLQPDFPCYPGDCHSEEMLAAVSSLVAQYGKIGSNLNQIARYLNEYGVPYNALSSEVRAAVSDLAALKFEVLKVIGEAYGNDQAYQL